MRAQRRYRPDALSYLLITTALLVGGVRWSSLAAQTPRAQPGLRIVILEGEDAVNIVQQRTAVAPVVEVRDRNDQPVAGAVVNFAIRSGRATFSGARTLSVTTNAAGRAAAAGFAPAGNGALQISATAAFQGQTAAAVTITQTTVQTAAQAAAVSGAGSAGGSGGGAATGAGASGTSAGGAGAGGGLSTATTVGIVGGAAAGGAVAAKDLLGGPGETVYTGTFAGPLVATGPPPFCGFTENMSGTLTIRIQEISTSAVKGSARLDVDSAVHYNASCRLTDLPPDHATYDSIPLTGVRDNLGFIYHQDYTFTAPDGSGTNNRGTVEFSFTGAFDGTQIVGTLTDAETNQSITGPPISNSGTAVFPITLR